MIAEIGQGCLIRLLGVGHYLILPLVQQDGVTFGRLFPLCAVLVVLPSSFVRKRSNGFTALLWSAVWMVLIPELKYYC